MIAKCNKFILNYLDCPGYTSESAHDKGRIIDAALIHNLVFDFCPCMLQNAADLDPNHLFRRAKHLGRLTMSFNSDNEMDGSVTKSIEASCSRLSIDWCLLTSRASLEIFTMSSTSSLGYVMILAAMTSVICRAGCLYFLSRSFSQRDDGDSQRAVTR